MRGMKCITFANDAYVPMVNEYLIPSIKEFELVWIKPDFEQESLFGTKNFHKIVQKKSITILGEMQKMADNEVFMYVDGDVMFFGLTPQMAMEDLGDAERLSRENEQRLMEYARKHNKRVPMAPQTSRQSQDEPVRNGRDAIPYNLSELDKDILREWYDETDNRDHRDRH